MGIPRTAADLDYTDRGRAHTFQGTIATKGNEAVRLEADTQAYKCQWRDEYMCHNRQSVARLAKDKDNLSLSKSEKMK